MGKWRWIRRIGVTVVVMAVVGTLVTAWITDKRSQARVRHERFELASARTGLSVVRTSITAGAFARGISLGFRNSLQSSTESVEQLMTLSEHSLGESNFALQLQGYDIGTLETCLGGVRSALQAISSLQNSSATSDIAAVSNACLSLEGGGTNGAVAYPYDFPDPFVLSVNGTYYAYATNSAEGNIQIIESTDLNHWNAIGNALPSLPSWANPSATWAPSVLQVGSSFVMYYSAQLKNGSDQCISEATATQAQGPFVDTSTAPLVCQTNLAGSIDPSPFVDSNGTPYLVWKSNGGAQPATIWSEQLTPAGTAFATGSSPTALLQPSQGWESSVVEAPDLALLGGKYYLFYSGNNWDSGNYAVGAAVCPNPVTPCAKPQNLPILATGPDFAGPGGETVFTDSSGNVWMAFDAYLPKAVGYPQSRVFFIRQLDLDGPIPAVVPSS